MTNGSEKLLSAFSEVYFYKELVQSNLCFISEGETEKEVADLLVNIGDFIIAIQLKARNLEEQSNDLEKELRWLTSKCKVAKRQVKESIKYIKSGKLPSFKNGRNQSIYLTSDAEIIPLVVFINKEIGNDYPHVLFKHSDTGMDINCMSFGDFQKMCKLLFTPMEVIQYLKWRLSFYQQQKKLNKNDDFFIHIHEQISVYQFIAKRYGSKENSMLESYITAFSDMLHKLPDRVIVESEQEDSYPLILFFAHFNRLEIKEYVERIYKSLDDARKGLYHITGSLRNIEQKYAILFVSTHDGYVFDMEILEMIAREKGNCALLLQVYCYWENNENFYINFCFKDSTNRYLK